METHTRPDIIFDTIGTILQVLKAKQEPKRERDQPEHKQQEQQEQQEQQQEEQDQQQEQQEVSDAKGDSYYPFGQPNQDGQPDEDREPSPMDCSDFSSASSFKPVINGLAGLVGQMFAPKVAIANANANKTIFHESQICNINHAFAIVDESKNVSKFIRIMNERQRPFVRCNGREMYGLLVVLFPEISKDRCQKLAQLLSIALEI